jgi:hypothetical protein
MKSELFPALNDSHVEHLAWAVDTYGEAWIHGSGDIFTETYPDPDHKTYKVSADENSNNAFNKASDLFSHSATKKFRKKYVKGDTLPTSVEQLEEELQNADRKARAAKMKENQTVRNVPVFTPKSASKETETAEATGEEFKKKGAESL